MAFIWIALSKWVDRQPIGIMEFNHSTANRCTLRIAARRALRTTSITIYEGSINKHEQIVDDGKFMANLIFYNFSTKGLLLYLQITSISTATHLKASQPRLHALLYAIAHNHSKTRSVQCAHHKELNESKLICTIHCCVARFFMFLLFCHFKAEISPMCVCNETKNNKIWIRVMILERKLPPTSARCASRSHNSTPSNFVSSWRVYTLDFIYALTSISPLLPSPI